MDEQVLKKFLTEYQINVSLWQHDDDVRQKRNTLYLTVNTILLSVLTLAITKEEPHNSIIIPFFVIIPFFGMLPCLVWFLIQRRNYDYVRFRRFQLRNLEKKIGHVNTFTNQHLALDSRDGAVFEHIVFDAVDLKRLDKDKKLSAKRWPSTTSTFMELFLPAIWGTLWAVLPASLIYLNSVSFLSH